jgi:exopolysaccharide production protein ExoY
MLSGISNRLSQQRQSALAGTHWNHREHAQPHPLPRPIETSVKQTWIANPPFVVGGSGKRYFDVCVAFASIVLWLPLLCLIAVAVKFADRGPILYRHRRVGRNGEAFDCLKFRTMVVDADAILQSHLSANCEAAREWAENHKLRSDPRITPLGAVLRKTSLDELPQLFNILKGEMSFVGPRPIVVAEVTKYGEYITHYMSARPGLTGPWQVGGRNDVDYACRVTLDSQYVENWSFWRDLAIITKTIRVIVTSRGCY